jgi:predicted TIM-barrel fold metal-dependent hydrolase
LHMTSFPPNAPLNGRPDWRPSSGLPGTDIAALRTQALDAFGTRFAICNVIYASQVFFNEDMAAVLCRAVNDWVTAEWLDKEPRLRASIMVSTQNPQLAADEIDRCAADPRFVQVLLLANTEMPAGRRYFWPIYEAAERHNLPVGFHAGSSYRFAPSNAGFPSFYVEEYAGNAPSFKGELLSLITEGVFQKFPKLTVVMIEAGFTWLPGYCWRIDKIWRGVRREVPWVKDPPSELIRRHVRFTLQPTHTPPDPKQCERVIDQIGSDDILLFSTDYPHWHFDGMDAFPNGFPAGLKEKVMVDNPLATYPRLQAGVATRERGLAS